MSTEETPISDEVITFKKRKRRGNLRAVDTDDVNEKEKSTADAEEVETDWTALDDFRELKKAKKRVQNGINILDLMNENNKKVVDKVKTEKRDGGLTDAKTLASELDLGNTFSIETNRRDEDAELMKYVEEELAKRRPQASEEGVSGSSASAKVHTSDDLLIRVIPEHLLKISSDAKAKSEEMLSGAMLSGIPEVDLGIEERIRNIEKTEAARTKLLQEKLRQLDKARGSNNDSDISLVPNNLASCFTRNNNIVQQAANATNHRFNLGSAPTTDKDMIEHFKEDKGNNSGYKQQVPKQTYEIEPVVVLGAEPQKVRIPNPIDKDKRMPGKDKPTDDYIFEKFRKQIKKH